MLKGKMVIGQSGGPTAVINQSLVGAVLAARQRRRLPAFLEPVMEFRALWMKTSSI